MAQSNVNPEMRIDKDGRWFFRGEEMTREDIVLYFYQHLRRDSDGNYLIEIENDRCRVNVEDAPYVVRSVTVECSKNDGQACIEISLTDGSSEELDYSKPLWTGDDNVMYCVVKEGKYPARFSRSAYYQLCKYVQYDSESGQYSITLTDRSYSIAPIKRP